MRYLYLVIFVLVSQNTYALELRGEVAGETRYFIQSSPYLNDDYDVNNSLYFKGEVFHAFNEYDDLLKFVPYFRFDQHDARRSHFDIRELSWIHVGDWWESRIGVYKVFWGVTEGRHLVDVINQTDLVDQPDGDEKLGQPMVNFAIAKNWGIVDIFLLSGFRERTFPGREGRPRLPLTVARNAVYDSDAKQYRFGAALRYQNYFEFGLEYAISHFSGTSREPILIPEALSRQELAHFMEFGELEDPDNKKFIPHYTVIDQTGFELQQQLEGWLFKLEAITRSGQGERFWAIDSGFEYTQSAAFRSSADIGWLVEYLWEDREEALASAFDNDILFGVRLTLNDAASTQALVSVMHDFESAENAYTFEASRRLSDRFKATLEARIFSNSAAPPSPSDVYRAFLNEPQKKSGFSAFSRSDFVQAELIYYF